MKTATKQSRIAQDWISETAVCIAGGPSLTLDDVTSIQGKARVIAVNNAYELAPWADILYGCDPQWWDWHDGAKLHLGERWTQSLEAAQKYSLNYVEGRTGNGLSVDPGYIHNGHNSGYQAINLAYHKGCRRVILLGYDMKYSDEGRSHWHGNHPVHKVSPYKIFMQAFKTIAEQNLIEVINCSRDTALECFPKLPLEDILWT